MSAGDPAAPPPSLMSALDVVMQLASGNYEARAVARGENDEIDALVAGINMLAEEVAFKFAENARLVEALEANIAQLHAQQQTILELSTPSLMVWRGIVVLPLVGILDSARAQRLSGELLNRVAQGAIDVVIIDVTGVGEVDIATTNYLLNTFRALRLLGARCILTGLGPSNARTMVTLDVDLSQIAIRGTLHDGLMLAFSMTGRRVVEETRPRGNKNEHRK